MTIGYEDVQVTEELLEEYEREKEQAVGPAKYGRFKAWLYYANIRRRQLQGLHENCLVGNTSQGVRTVHCICGLYLSGSEEQDLGLLSPEIGRAHV